MLFRSTGSGSIRIGQSGAGIEIDGGGNVSMFGKTVTLEGKNGVKFKGKVNWEIGAGAALSLAALPALAIFNQPACRQCMLDMAGSHTAVGVRA